MKLDTDQVTDSWVVQQAVRKYRNEGPVELARSAPRWAYATYVQGRMRKLILSNAMAGKMVTREELKRRTGSVGRLWEYGSEERFFVAPNDETELPPELERKTGWYTAEKPFVCELRDARLVGRQPIALTSDGEVVLETADANRTYLFFRLEDLIDQGVGWNRAGWDTAGEPLYVSDGGMVAEARNATSAALDVRRRIQSVAESPAADRTMDLAFPMIRYPISTYYHWILEFLPKVRGLERYREATGRDPPVLIEPDPPSWMLETLELVGVDREDCREWDVESASIDRLVVPFHRKRVMPVPGRHRLPEDFNPSVLDCEWLRERVLSNVSDEKLADDSYPSRVYVSRERTNHNRVRNLEEVKDTLADRGFVPVVLEEMSVEDQVALFTGVEAVVAPHGSGLVNLVFADDPSVVELFQSVDTRAFYFCLAAQLGLDYACLQAPSDQGEMTVDTDELARVVDDHVR